MSGVSLADWLRAQPDTVLAALLAARPDLATPPPPDTLILATRAGTRASVARATEDLDTIALAVLDTLLLTDADRRPVPADSLPALLAAPGESADRAGLVAAALARLRSLALVWGEDEVHLVPAARDSAPYPAGLGHPAAALDGVDVSGLLAGLPEPLRRVLAALDESGPIGRTKDASPDADPATPVRRLIALNLLTTTPDGAVVELPRQVGIALRGGRPFRTDALVTPELATRSFTRSTVDATGAGEVLELVRHLEGLLELWSAEPPGVLRSGGLGVRDLRKLAKTIDVDEARAGLLAELAVGTQLVADSESTSAEWVPTAAADGWLASTPAQRWAVLADAWLNLPRLPGLIGRRDDKDRLIGPLTEDLRRPLAPRDRRRVLDTLAELAPGTGVTSPETLAALLNWRAPRRGGRMRDDLVRWTLAEATSLGVIAFGGLTGAGRALLTEGATTAVKRMADAMPAPIDHILVQADLTVVAPGPLEPLLANDIALTADIESAGSATVYRVSETSVRRALDAGRTGTDLHELFRSRSRTPIPQALTYLIDDVARRHGRLRGGTASSFLRCDDEALLAEVMANPESAILALRRIAPTVLVSPLPLAQLLTALRNAGFTPAAEDSDGTVLDLRSPGRRIPARPKPKRHLPSPPTEDQLSALVRNMRMGDRAAATPRGAVTHQPAGGGAASITATLALLQQATRDNHPVWIGLVDAHGIASQHVVHPIRIGAGVLEATESESPDTPAVTRHFPLHLITRAARTAP